MGGNLVLKLAGEVGASNPLLRAVAAVSPALDLGPSSAALHEPANRLYERKFRAALLKRFRRKAMLFPRVYDPARADGIRSLREFDDRITALYSGFSGADDYYHRAAAARVVAQIAVPTLILHALDDPFIRMTPESCTLLSGESRDHVHRDAAWRTLRLPRSSGREVRLRRLLGGVDSAQLPPRALTRPLR